MLADKDIDFDEYYANKFKNGIVVIRKDKDRRFVDANGNVFVATSKQWTSEDTNIIFEKDREFIEKYLEEERR